MRTKTLLLTAALSAAGIATSMAQGVYSVNAVGYVNKDLVAGFNLVSNPLTSTEANGNQIQNLFNSLPNNTAVYQFNGTRFDIVTKDPDFGWDPADVADNEVRPGSGVFVRLAAPATVTFVGEVPQGNLQTQMAAGFTIVSSQVPQSGTATALGYTPVAGDALYFWDKANQKYIISGYDAEFGIFDPALPTLEPGDAFFRRGTAPNTWTRNFSVNQ
jgi:hypothetical protein